MTQLELRAPGNLASPRARWYWAVRAGAVWLVIIVVQVLIWIGATDPGPAHLTVLVITVLLAAAHLGVMPQWRYRVHRWEATDTAVYTQSGWFTQDRRVAPIVRIQTVDTQRGPFEQAFGLTNVTVTTASAAGPLKIHALDRSTAEGLVTELTHRTQQSADDGT